MSYRFVRSPNHATAAGREIGFVVIRTMEIAERKGAAEACARWFASPSSEVSAHLCVDADTVIQCVHEEDIAWHARGGNAGSVGIELAGFASQGLAGWRDAYKGAVLQRAAGSRPRCVCGTGSRCGACGPPRRDGARRRERGVPQERH
jgi:N-acetyl-anhydromuramyl-L-alanine amidase AmpD